MRIHVLSIFPDLFKGFIESSLIAKAQQRKLLEISLVNIRDFSDPPHNKVDDEPYGGGAGMLMKPEPLARAIESSLEQLPNARVYYMSPSGEVFNQRKAEVLATENEVIIICGRYEGIDQRVIDLLVDEEISIGDYVLMGGEVPAMVVIEASTRLVSEVLGNSESAKEESFATGQNQKLLEAPNYTRPEEFRGVKVPEVLLSGNHSKIKAWKESQALTRTKDRRPDLLCKK